MSCAPLQSRKPIRDSALRKGTTLQGRALGNRVDRWSTRPYSVFSSSESHGKSIEMKNLLHLCPPFAWFSCRKRFLHRLHHRPPFLCFGMCSHLGPVTFHIGAVIFEVAEETAVFEINRVVSDVAFQNLLQNLRPNRRVISLVEVLTAWF